MSKSYLDAVVGISRKRKKYFDNYMEYAELIKTIATKILGEVEVILFGSFAEGEHTMASDIDVAIISDSIQDRDRVLLEINRALGLPHPFELHLITRKEFELYKKFIKTSIRV